MKCCFGCKSTEHELPDCPSPVLLKRIKDQWKVDSSLFTPLLQPPPFLDSKWFRSWSPPPDFSLSAVRDEQMSKSLTIPEENLIKEYLREELALGRLAGPFTREEMFSYFGENFQSSPAFIVHSSEKDRPVRHYSFPSPGRSYPLSIPLFENSPSEFVAIG